MALFDTFPHLENDFIIIRKMELADLESLTEITSNDNVYKFIPPLLFKKSKGNLIAAIKNIGGRDFIKKKYIIAGIYLKSDPKKLVGLAQMFDYKKRFNKITIGYTINEAYWHRGVATNAAALMKKYLCETEGIKTLYAYVMPENINSSKVLLKNGFKKLPEQTEGKNWGGKETCLLDYYTYSKI